MSDQPVQMEQDHQSIPVAQPSDQQTSSDTPANVQLHPSSDNNASITESGLSITTESSSNHQTDNAADASSSNQHIGDATSNQTTPDQSNQPSDDSSAPHVQTDTVADNEEDDDEEDYDEDDNSWLTCIEIPFSPESVSDVTLHYDCTCFGIRASYHLHRLTLITMSKYFDVALVDAQDATPSTCKLTERCQLPGHRCLQIGSDEIGGRAFSHNELNAFFRHLYSVADGSGHWNEVTEKERNRSISRFCYLKHIKSVSSYKNEIVIDAYEYDGIHEVTMKRSDFLTQNKETSTDVGTVYWADGHSTDPDDENPHYHLANYFQCDPLMKLYAKQAEVVVQAIIKYNAAYAIAWELLRLCDKYNWTNARKSCLQAVARDKKCRERASWKQFAKSLKFDTLLEAFYTSLERVDEVENDDDDDY